MRKIKVLLLFLVGFIFTLTAHPASSFSKDISKDTSQTGSLPIETKIIDGKEPDMKKWPWIASVRKLGLYHFSECTASLIDKEWVLTAAHCITEDVGDDNEWKSLNPDGLGVTIGERHIMGKDPVPIEAVFPHPGYERSGDSPIKNDIGLIKLKNPIAKPIADVARDNSNDYPAVAEIAGYGAVCLYNQTIACLNGSFLFEGVSRVLSERECEDAFDLGPRRHIICTLPGTATYGKPRICFGDSGGPLVVRKGGRALIIGVTSFTGNADDPCNETYPGGHTSAGKYYRWISHHVNQDMSMSIGGLQNGGLENSQKRKATITVKNRSAKWALSLKEIIINGAGRYCSSEKTYNLLRFEQRGLQRCSTFFEYHYSSKENGLTNKRGPLRVVKNNCPLFLPGQNLSDEFFYNSAGSALMLGPGGSCRIQIQIQAPTNIKTTDPQGNLVSYSNFSATPGAQVFSVEANQGPPNQRNINYKKSVVGKSCIDQTVSGERLKEKWPKRCSSHWQDMKKDPIGQFFLKNCPATTRADAYSAECQALLSR